MKFMINYLSKTDIKEIKDKFEEIDIEHNGVITYHDLKHLLLQQGKNKEEVEEVFNEMEYRESD